MQAQGEKKPFGLIVLILVSNLWMSLRLYLSPSRKPRFIYRHRLRGCVFVSRCRCLHQSRNWNILKMLYFSLRFRTEWKTKTHPCKRSLNEYQYALLSSPLWVKFIVWYFIHPESMHAGILVIALILGASFIF